MLSDADADQRRDADEAGPAVGEARPPEPRQRERGGDPADEAADVAADGDPARR